MQCCGIKHNKEKQGRAGDYRMVEGWECANLDAVVREAFLRRWHVSCPVRKLVMVPTFTDKVRYYSTLNPQSLAGVWLHSKCSKNTSSWMRKNPKRCPWQRRCGGRWRHPLCSNTTTTAHFPGRLVNFPQSCHREGRVLSSPRGPWG